MVLVQLWEIIWSHLDGAALLGTTVKNLTLNLTMQKVLECWFIELDFLDIQEQCKVSRTLLSAKVLCQILIYGETNNKILIALWYFSFSKTLHSNSKANPHPRAVIIFPLHCVAFYRGSTVASLYIKVLQILLVICWTSK